MILAAKQLFRQLVKNRFFISLLFIMSMLSSLAFFFVRFSIDKNRASLKLIPVLNENQQAYAAALSSNSSLSYAFFAAMAGMSVMVIVIFFHRFFRTGRRQLGCLKALGFSDHVLCCLFTGYMTAFTGAGALCGLPIGYLLSEVLIRANEETYGTLGLTRGISPFSLFMGLFVSTGIYCLASCLSFLFVRGKETAVLMAGNMNKNKVPAALSLADKIARSLPLKNKLPLRIAFRKPTAVLLILAAVFCFCVCFILGYSLNRSGGTAFDMQTMGRSYEYNTRYPEYRSGVIPDGAMAYLECPASALLGSRGLPQTAAGLYEMTGQFELMTEQGRALPVPEPGFLYITTGFAKTWGVDTGDQVVLEISGMQEAFTVSGITYNGEAGFVYLNGAEAAGLLGLPGGSYNGLLTSEPAPEEGSVTTREQEREYWKNNITSNRLSAVINQLAGGIGGCILIFLALYMNFEDNTHDMLILGMLGYKGGEIRRLLMDVYRPVVWAAFLIGWLPASFLARSIQSSFSRITGDYMPFESGPFTALAAFALLNLIYYLGQALFGLGIRRIISRGERMEEI